MSTLILLNKPYQVLSQFSDKDGRATLADYVQQKNVYPAGRLDYDSEGLLLLTADGALQHAIADPRYKLPKTYYAQVEGAENTEAVKQLSRGIPLKDGPTQAAAVNIIDTPTLWARTPPIRKRNAIPTHWLSITISEGRNRQVRRMTAAVGLPTLRLVRMQIGDWSLNQLQPGEYQTIDAQLPQGLKGRQARSKPKHRYSRKTTKNTSRKS